MSTYDDGTPKEVLSDLSRALADKSVRGKVNDDPEGTLRKAGVDVDQLPDGALDAFGSASDEELHRLGEACATIHAFSDKAGLATNEFL